MNRASSAGTIREFGQAEGFGGAYGGNDRCRSSRDNFVELGAAIGCGR
jgi:hypothetical protein